MGQVCSCMYGGGRHKTPEGRLSIERKILEIAT